MSNLPATLFEQGCIQFGDFTLKSGLKSPIYIDLRLLVSNPTTLKQVAGEMAAIASRLEFDRIAAIPYAGLPIGVALALELGSPLIYPRREKKAHGLRRDIEGVYYPGETALIVDDLITRGDSKLEVIDAIQGRRLTVHDILVLIDREQGGSRDLRARGYCLHAVLGLRQMLDSLLEDGHIQEHQYEATLHYLSRE
jgi:orotate phosphoribosyltransferase